MADRTLGGQCVGLHPVTKLPRWRLIVLAVASVGTAVVAGAVVDFAKTGLTRPLVAALGLVATVVVNRVYVVVARRGQVIEGIDIAEAAIVALAMVLPAGEAVLVFVAASVLIELRADRARVKKVFNVGIRAAGAGIVVVSIAVIGRRTNPDAYEVLVAAAGAAAYTLTNAISVAAVVASVQPQPIAAILREDIRERLLVAALAIVAGIFSGYAALQAPAALLAIAAALVLILLTSVAAQRAQHESRRLHHLLKAITRIHELEGDEEQDSVLLEVAHELLLWKDISIRDAPPDSDERGAQLQARDGRDRWLVVQSRAGSDPWTADDQRMVEALVSAAAGALERAALQAQLARQALLDPLTGVANRRRFDEQVARLCADGKPRFSLILCDLDHFKSVNDRLGHEAGDDLLRVAAGRLAASVRSGDLVARLGGDEFVVLLPGVVSQVALEAIKTKIAMRFSEPVAVGRWQLSSLPNSIGTATAPRDGHTPRDLLRVADEAMYDVKRAHRQASPAVSVVIPESRRESATPPVLLSDQTRSVPRG